MRIGFDLDGVILKINLGFLRMMDMINKDGREEIEYFYYSNPEIQLNPFDYASDEDEVFIITARNLAYKIPTIKLIDKYFPKANLVMLDFEEPDPDIDLTEWYKKQAEKKANAINQLKIEVYFEDSPTVVKFLREKCPNCKVICYSRNRLI